MSGRLPEGSPAAFGEGGPFWMQRQQDPLQQQQDTQQLVLPFVCFSAQGPPERLQGPKDQAPCKLQPCTDATGLGPEEQRQPKQQQQCEESSSGVLQALKGKQAEGPMAAAEVFRHNPSSAIPAEPTISSNSNGNNSSSSNGSNSNSNSNSGNGSNNNSSSSRPLCESCRGLYFHPPKVVSPPARTQEELLQPPSLPRLRWDLLQQPEVLLSHCTIPSSSRGSRSRSKVAGWWTAEAQRELFASPFDAAGFPRLPRGVPEKSRLAERGAVSVDLGACIQKQSSLQQQQHQGRQDEKRDKCNYSSSSSSSSTDNHSRSSSTDNHSTATCSQCNGMKLTFGPAGDSLMTRGPSSAGTRRRGPLLGASLRRRLGQQQQHASDDSSASSGSEVAAGELLPDVYLRLAGRRRDCHVVGVEADWLMRLQDPPQGLEALDVFAAAAAAAAAPVAVLEPLASPADAAALITAVSCSSTSSSSSSSNSDSSNSSNGHLAETEPVLDPRAPYRPLTYIERLIAFAHARALTSPPFRLSLPQQQQQQQRQQRQPLPMLAALISRELLRRGVEAAAAAAGGGPAAGIAAAAGAPRQRRRGLRPLQCEAHQLNPRLLRKALRCFDRSKGGLSRSSSSSSSSRVFADFAAVKARLVGLAFGDISFDPDGLWLRTQQMQQQRQQQQLLDPEQQQLQQQQQQQQQQQRLDGTGASGTSTLPLMQAAMRRVRLSAKYRHPSVRISSGSSSGRAQGGGFWQKASVDLGCGAVLATHAASTGSYYFEVLVGPVPQQQQQQMLQQPKHRLSPQQQLQQQQQQVAVSSQCDLRVGWSTRRHPPSAPLGSTRDSVALTLKGTAAWAGVEVPCCYPPLVEGDVIGCCIRLLQPEETAQQQQQQAAAAEAAAAAADAYSVSCLMDVDRLAQGFLRSAAGLSEGPGGPSGVSEAPGGSLVQFTVNGRALSPCCFKPGTTGYLLGGEYFPAVSLMGGASCFVNFGPSFSYLPPVALPPYSPSCLLPLPVAPPLTFDVYPLLLLPQQLLADPELNVLRPRTFADVLEQCILTPQQQPCPSHDPPSKRRALEAPVAGAATALESKPKGASHEVHPPQSTAAGQPQQAAQKQALTMPREDSTKPYSQHEHAEASVSSSSTTTTNCCCGGDGPGGPAGGPCCRWKCKWDFAEAEMVRAAHALVLSPEERRQLQTGLRRQQQRQKLLRSIHRCAFESQLKSCHAVLDAAVKEWGVSRAYCLRRKRPWVRHRSNLCGSSDSRSSSSSSSDNSSSDGSVTPTSPRARHHSMEGALPVGVSLQQLVEASTHAAVPAALAPAEATAPLVATAASSGPEDISSSSSNNRDHYVDFKHPCSVLFSFFLPTLAGLYPPASPRLSSSASPQTSAGAAATAVAATGGAAAGGGLSADGSSEEAEAVAAWKRFARLFWFIVAPLDSQRRPLSPTVFISNEAIAAQRKAKPSAAVRAAAASPPAAASAPAAAGAPSAGAGFPAGEAAAAGGGAAAAGSGANPTSRSGRSSGGLTRRKGSSTPGPQSGAAAGTAAGTAADAVPYETVQVGQLTLRVPQGSLADSGDEEALTQPDAPVDGAKGKRTAAGSSSLAEENDGSDAVPLIEPLPLPQVLLRRLGLKPRQLLEALGCRFRIVSRQLAGSHSAIAGVHCIHTAVVRLRQMQAKAQAAEEEAAKDVACEFWLEQHASALCGL